MKIYLIGGGRDFLEKIQIVLNDEGIKDTKIFISKEVSPKELAENAPDCEILVASPSGFRNLTREHMKSMPNLKFITTTSVGTDWIDIQAAKELNIVVSNQKGVNSEAVAEHCFGMILDLSKRITKSDRDIREEKVGDLSKYTGINLFGKTLGIIGTGDVGKKIARIARGFNMKILGTNKSKIKLQDIEIVDLELLLKKSDIVAVAVPLTDDTEDLLSSKEFEFVKKGAIIVSIAREKVINIKAILQALNTNKLFGFGLDAEIAVPISKDDPYLQSDKIVITPHTASITEESEKGYASMTAENIKAFQGGKLIRV